MGQGPLRSCAGPPRYAASCRPAPPSPAVAPPLPQAGPPACRPRSPVLSRPPRSLPDPRPAKCENPADPQPPKVSLKPLLWGHQRHGRFCPEAGPAVLAPVRPHPWGGPPPGPSPLPPTGPGGGGGGGGGGQSQKAWGLTRQWRRCPLRGVPGPWHFSPQPHQARGPEPAGQGGKGVSSTFLKSKPRSPGTEPARFWEYQPVGVCTLTMPGWAAGARAPALWPWRAPSPQPHRGVR